MEGSSTSHQKGRIATTPRSLAVQELTGMGFSKEEALNALETEKWNLEAATNFLLDNA
jgi:epidermal growth factor receptor substrate 15